MRAIEFGAPSVLQLVELPTPEPGQGEVLVSVEAISVNWLDTQIRLGRGPDVFAVKPPYIPGGSVAGTITAIGSGTDSHWLGVRVLAQASGDGYGGGYTDTVITTPNAVFPVPDELDLRVAMALMDDGNTALAVLEKTPVHKGDRVLIAPGVGGLGNLLVQLVLAQEALPIAAVRGSEKLVIARKLGAEAVDYSAPNWTDQVRSSTDGHGVDVVFDGIGGETGTAAVKLLASGGRFSGYGMASGGEASIEDSDRERLTVTGMSQLVEFWPDTPRRIKQVLQLAADGDLTPIIGQTYPLAEAARAHRDIEERNFIGKSLLVI